MYMSKKKFDEIKAKHSTTIVVDADVGEALAFVQDLLEAEADAIKNRESHATASIGRLNEAAYPCIRGRRGVVFVMLKPGRYKSEHDGDVFHAYRYVMEVKETAKSYIYTLFQLAKVRDDNRYVNGFTDKLLRQSEIDLGASRDSMPCLLDEKKIINYPCSRACPLFGDCVTKWYQVRKRA